MIKKRTKWEPTKKQLQSAWHWKKKGWENKRIAEKIGSTLPKYQSSLSTFKLYYLQEAKKEKFSGDIRKYVTPQNMADVAATKGRNYKAGERKLEEEDIDLEKLRSYVICGFNRDKIAGYMGITRQTLYKYALAFPNVQHILDNAQKEATAGVMSSLLGMTKDRMMDDVAVAAYLGDITTKNVKKGVAGSFPAVKYFLANTIGWGSEPKKETTDNSGSIIRMMDNLANHEEGVGPVDEEEK